MASDALIEIETRKTISSKSPSSLSRILAEGVLLARWERTALAGAEPGLKALRLARGPVAITTTSRQPADFHHQLCTLVPTAGPQERDSLRILAEDACELATIFAHISGREHLRLRLERVEDDGCALFHVDTLPLRMVCTYSGPGTQWLEEDNVRRDQLGARGRSLEEANAAIVVDPAKIQTAPAWHVLLFKGRLWEGHGYYDGLVHRSAPVRHPRDHRLRLTVDYSNSCSC